jgi:hypothetical protein
MNVGRCRPQMWGLRWGYLETLASVPEKRKPCPMSVATLFGGRVKAGAMGWLDQIQFDGSLDGRPTIRDVEFAVDVLGVGADCAQADYEFTGDLRPR